MKKVTQDISPIAAQVDQLAKQIPTCKKFINSTSIDRVTVIFSGIHIGIPYDEIFVLDKPGSQDKKHLNDFFQHIGDVLYSQKILLEQNLTSLDQLQVFDKAAKKLFNNFCQTCGKPFAVCKCKEFIPR